MLSERKKKILCAVVDGYIDSAQPISSKEILQHYQLDCSSATIRNELSTLESMGYLVQPYVSAGRVPSQKAFRLYVDELMSDDPLTPTDVEVINSYFERKIDSVEDMVERVAKAISDITNYTAVVVKEDLSDCITNIRLVDLSNGKLLVIIVTDTRVLKDAIIDLPDDFSDSMIDSSEQWLNKIFVGKHVSQFLNFEYPMTLINDQFVQLNTLFKKIIDVLKQVSIANGMEISTSGHDKIFEHQEYSDIDHAKSFLSTLDHKQQLVDIFCDQCTQQGTSIKIGTQDSMPDGTSAVSAKITLGDNIVGNIGVIGPVRMNYKKVVSVLDTIGGILDDIIKDL